MADNIHQFQAGREAAMNGAIRDRRKSSDWLEGYDQTAPRNFNATGGE